MKTKIIASGGSAKPEPEALWVTTGFATEQLHGHRVMIEWWDENEVADLGIYQLSVASYGHSRHIQNVRAVPLVGESSGTAVFEFDQTDADLLHRTNENPKAYDFIARLIRGRSREQNLHLEKLVRERRMRKVRDVEGADHWESPATPVLKTVQVRIESCPLPEDPHVPRRLLH